jgi:hypothetical protein
MTTWALIAIHVALVGTLFIASMTIGTLAIYLRGKTGYHCKR